MAIYRFRVTFEDNDEVYREIDIKSTQTFYELHVAILAAVKFEDNCDSSFFVSDDMWRRGDEIFLRYESEDAVADKRKKNDAPKYDMKKCKVVTLVDDPHQKFIYAHDPQKTWLFTVELIKILPDDPKVIYPKCTKSVGVAPLKVKKVLPPVVDSELDELDEEGDSHDDEAYAHASEEFDTEGLGTDNHNLSDTDEADEDAVGEESEEDEFGDDFGEESDSGHDSFEDEH